MFVTRLISGIVLVLLAVLFLVTGGIELVALLAILALIGGYELMRVFKMEKSPFAYIIYVATVCYYYFLYLASVEGQMATMIFALVALLVVYVLQYPKWHIDKVTSALFALVYVSIILGYIYRTRCMEGGNWLVWLIIIGSWGSDTCAYTVGILIGKHHFSELSPKKTIEGCVGGIVGAGLIGVIYALFFPFHHIFTWSPIIIFPLVAVVCAVISQLGDLAASAIKRNYDVKDYGHLIPGHGGILDRFDSVIFVAPFVYYLLLITT